MNHHEAGLDGLRIVITGGARGIGRATAEAAAARGGRPVSVDLHSVDLPNVLSVTADLTDQSSVSRAIDEASNALGGLDVLVNNAGVGAVGTVEDNDEDEWRHVLDVNVLGIVRATRAALPFLRTSTAAAIVNVSSAVAEDGFPGRACYSASKGAVSALTYAMAADLVGEGVRVNAVRPGTIDTEWVGRLLSQADDPKVAKAALEARQPLGRLGAANEVAEAILFLASAASRFCTGSILAVDGGISGVRAQA